MRKRSFFPLSVLLFSFISRALPAAEVPTTTTAIALSDAALQEVFGSSRPIPLWPTTPPLFLKNAPPEQANAQRGQIKMVSKPAIVPYLPPREKSTGMALIVCPGGGYGALGWSNVHYMAEYFLPRGIAIIGLKYRTRPPFRGDNAGIQHLALLDARRAVRLVRAHASEWNIDPHQIGVVGYSAGANLTINLAANFHPPADELTSDPVDLQSSRPDFVVGCSTWHWRQKQSPFVFHKDSPPVFMVHATNDGIQGGAPIELPKAIKADLERLGVPVHLQIYDQGAHGVGNLIPQRVQHNFPPTKWPEELLKWLKSLPQTHDN